MLRNYQGFVCGGEYMSGQTKQSSRIVDAFVFPLIAAH